MPRTEALKIYRDGREECLNNAAGKRLYAERTETMAARQNWKCAICTRILARPTFDHQDGRGMGGSRRTDAIVTPEGLWLNAALCCGCNHAKGSARYKWNEHGFYVPNIREVQEAA